MAKGGERTQGAAGGPIPYGYGRSANLLSRFQHQDSTLVTPRADNITAIYSSSGGPDLIRPLYYKALTLVLMPIVVATVATEGWKPLTAMAARATADVQSTVVYVPTPPPAAPQGWQPQSAAVVPPPAVKETQTYSFVPFNTVQIAAVAIAPINHTVGVERVVPLYYQSRTWVYSVPAAAAPAVQGWEFRATPVPPRRLTPPFQLRPFVVAEDIPDPEGWQRWQWARPPHRHGPVHSQPVYVYRIIPQAPATATEGWQNYQPAKRAFQPDASKYGRYVYPYYPPPPPALATEGWQTYQPGYAPPRVRLWQPTTFPAGLFAKTGSVPHTPGIINAYTEQVGANDDRLFRTWWMGMQAGDTGEDVPRAPTRDRCWQVWGTFGGGAMVAIEGSNDDTNYFTLTDISGSPAVLSAAGIISVIEIPHSVRPRVIGGSNVDLTVILTQRQGWR